MVLYPHPQFGGRVVPSFPTDDILIAVRKNSGQLNAQTTSLAGFTDISVATKGTVNLSLAAATTQIEPVGGSAWGDVLPGNKSGTLSIEMVRSDGNADDDEGAREGPKIFEDAFAGDRRLQFVIQPRRSPLTSGGSVDLNPSDENPLYQGSMVLTSVDVWGPGGANASVISVSANLRSDFKKYP